MIMVEHDHDKLVEAAKRNDTGFEVLANDFGIKENYCGETVTYLNKHIAEIAKEALRLAAQKLPCKTKFVVREDLMGNA